MCSTIFTLNLLHTVKKFGNQRSVPSTLCVAVLFLSAKQSCMLGLALLNF